jgi:hypothetical protein
MGTEESSYTIAGFCKIERISEPTYYALRKAGLGPREMRNPIANTVRISPEARREWHKMLENPPAELAKIIKRKVEQLQAKAQMGAQAAIKSGKHVSNLTQEERARQKRAAKRRREMEAA